MSSNHHTSIAEFNNLLFLFLFLDWVVGVFLLFFWGVVCFFKYSETDAVFKQFSMFHWLHTQSTNFEIISGVLLSIFIVVCGFKES